MGDLDIVGIKEMAERLGVRQQTAAAWRHRNLLPPQEGTVSGAPAWSWATIERWAQETGRLSGVAEFVADATRAIRVIDGVLVDIQAGVVVRSVSAPFPHPVASGGLENHVRFQAMDGHWYELPSNTYLRATGAAGGSGVGTALLAAGAMLGVIVLADQASKQSPPSGS